MNRADVIQETFFGPNGFLARYIPGYEPRPEQVRLSRKIDQALTKGTHMAGEAPPGTGKTMAYLAPTVVHRRRALVAVHTKALQHQIAAVDIPRVQQAFPELKAVVLKGIHNYVCLSEYDHAVEQLRQQELPGFKDRGSWDMWDRLRDWIETQSTHDGRGDLRDLTFAVTPELRELVTTTAEDCLGARCRFAGRCFSRRVKAEAATADVVLTNQALLVTGLRIKAMTGKPYLPPHDVIILDEADALDDVATTILGLTLTARAWHRLQSRVGRLIRHLHQPSALLSKAFKALEATAAEATHAADRWFEALAVSVQRDSTAPVKAPDPMLLANTRAVVLRLDDALTLLGISKDPKRTDQATAAVDEQSAERWVKAYERGVALGHDLQLILTDEPDHVRYVAKEGRDVAVHRRPLSVAPWLREHLWEQSQTIAVSATLTAERAFTYWARTVGCPKADTLSVPSPFNFWRQTLLYVPADAAALVPPQDHVAARPAYVDRLAEEIEALLKASEGRAFVLFTSHRALRDMATRLSGRLPWRVLVQGDLETPEMIRQFKDDGHAVLFGTRTFWRGVDVPGEALSLVIIDKIPFRSPGDPIWAARCDTVNARDGARAAFKQLTVPDAILTLKQGVGRLIRSAHDRGVLALLDGRLSSKYRWMLDNLPRSRRTTNLADVEAFFAQKRGSTHAD